MCGIVATLGNKQASQFIIEGLEALEYRGYDSAGLAVFNKEKINCLKSVGSVDNLKTKLETQNFAGSLGVGHTRWATHGQVLTKNAHPHFDEKEQFYVVHNGIIENYDVLKEFLIAKGYKFNSSTDSEVIAQLLAYNYRKLKDVKQALIESLQALKGAYAVAVISEFEPDKLYGAKLSGPLILGIGDKQAYYLTSDRLALAEYSDQIIFLEDYDLIEISSNDYKITNLKSNQTIKRSPEMLSLSKAENDLAGFEDFMSKEIHYIPTAISNVILGRLNLDQELITLGGLNSVVNQLEYIDRIIIVACGTSYYAGMVGEYLLEEIASIPVEVQLASEFKHRQEPLSRSTALIFISQSGETADTIGAIEKIKDSGMLKIGIVNTVGSTISRLTDAGVYCRAGVEKSVASTKAFVSQVTVLTLIALYLSDNYSKYSAIMNQLTTLPQILTKFLDNHQIKALAKKYSKYDNFLFLGRGYNYPVALEGALKLKEISYIHAEALPTGEIKHGTLALIDKNFPCFIIALDDVTLEKTYSNIAEIKARHGKVIALVDNPKSKIIKLVDDVIVIDKLMPALQPLMSGMICHLFAYHVAKHLNRKVDRPRNLAKSVTVE